MSKMKLFNYFKSILYKEKTVSSEAQFEIDFLEYPPFPLANRGLKSEFNTVDVYGPGRSLYFLGLFYKCFFDEEYQLNNNLDGSLEIIRLRESLKEQGQKCRKSFSDMKDEFRSLSLVKRLILSMIFILFSPLLLLALLIPATYLAARFAMVIINFNRITFGNFGAFIPLVKGKEVIVLRSNLAKKGKISVPAIISHEHIHFLQYVHNDFHKKITIKNPRHFIKKDLLTRHILYLFEVNEVEARLHELVLSYYRKFKKLPQGLDGFMDIVLSSHEMSPLFKNFTSREECFTPLCEEERFFIRERKVADELVLMLLSFKNEDYMLRFVSEVMAVMYGNLLNLYGDEEASDFFKKQIVRPNFYDQLYGRVVGGEYRGEF